MALRGETKAWANHPVVKAWRGYELALASYGFSICLEWRKRGYKDVLIEYFNQKMEIFDGCYSIVPKYTTPHFISNPEVNRMYRRILTHKNPEWYGQFWDEEPLEKCDYSLLK